MRNLLLYLTVFVSGAAILALEILGTRILGPFYGVGLYLWSALITVTLAALSAGYALGGWLADRHSSYQRLYVLFLGAGIWLLLIPALRDPVLGVLEPAGLRLAVIIAAIILFFVPLFLLGMVSPYAVKLKAQTLAEVGRAAGSLYAISTIASVAAALATGFLLIPAFGVQQLVLGIGIVLLITAAIGSMVTRANAQAGASSAAALLAIAVFGVQNFQSADPESGLLEIRQSPYAEIRVVETNGLRHLLIDGGTHTIVEPESWTSHFPYVALMDVPKYFFEEPGEALLIGLGGGSVMQNYAADNWRIDGVEIDAAVVATAYSWFGLEPKHGAVHVTDGRQYLKQTSDRYEIILMDAFGSSSIPFHLITREVFGLIRDRLEPDGIFAMNMEVRAWDDLLLRTAYHTLKQRFSEVYVMPAAVPANRVGNVVMIGANREFELVRPLEATDDDSRYPLQVRLFRNWAWENRFVPDTRRVGLLTDNHNPVDIWADEVNLESRIGLHRYFRESGMSW